MTVMDSTEAQLRFGSALAASTDPAHPGHPLYVGSRSGRGGASVGGSGIVGSSSSHHHHHAGDRPTFSSSRGTSFAASHATLAPADPQANRRDFLTYALSLMRGHNSEHSDSLPVIDVSAMKHIAYVFDALIYFLRNGTQTISEDPAVDSRPSSVDDAFAVQVTFQIY